MRISICSLRIDVGKEDRRSTESENLYSCGGLVHENGFWVTLRYGSMRFVYKKLFNRIQQELSGNEGRILHSQHVLVHPLLRSFHNQIVTWFT